MYQNKPTIDSQQFDSSESETKSAYSNYFEVQLEEKDFGLSRVAHNSICNQQLINQKRSGSGLEL